MDFESILSQLFSVILSPLPMNNALVVLVLTIFWDSMSLCAASFERKVVSLHSFIHLFKSRLKIENYHYWNFRTIISVDSECSIFPPKPKSF